MDTVLIQLCKKLHINRVAECNTFLQDEIGSINNEILRSILVALSKGIKLSTNQANSSLLYCLGITDVPPKGPLKKKGGTLPDIDIDFEKRYRDRVIQYVISKYGQDRVAHIGTFGTNRAKNAVRSIARTLDHPYEIGDELARLLLAPIAGRPVPIRTSIEQVPELKKYLDKGGARSQILQLGEQVEGLITNVGVHASGIVIANESILDTVPLFKGKSDEITTQWEMNTVEDVGYIKFDFLGLDALTKIHLCVDIIKERHGIDIDINNIDLDDPQVFINLRSGDTIGVFQLEASSGMRDLLVQIRPTHLEDLIALVAIYRPGPMGSPEVGHYLEVRAGKAKPHFLVPELEPILGKTDGLIIYQEQCMQIAHDLCGYTKSETDDLRKAIGKKIHEKMAKHASKFKEGWVNNNLPEDKGNELWEQMVAFASYGFNRSHAAAYAYITYQTAYLKTHYPTEFMCAIMIAQGGNRDDIIKCITECKRLGIKVLPPDINKSGTSFTVSNDNEIRFGLGPVKNLGASPVAEIIKERKGGKFASLLNFCERVNFGVINRLKVESLIRAGAFDALHESRRAMLETVDSIWNWREQKKRYDSKVETYYKKLEAYTERLEAVANGALSDTGKKLKPFKKPELPEPPGSIEMSEIDEMSEQELQKNEHELLGFFVSSHPLENFKYAYGNGNITTIESAKDLPSGIVVGLAVVITTQTEITTKKRKQKMAFLTLEDLSGSIESVIFPSTYDKCKDSIVESEPLLIEGKTDVVQTDDGKVTKIIVNSITPITMQRRTTNELLEANVRVDKAQKLLDLLDKYKGDVYKVRVSLTTTDGTKFRFPDKYSIGDYKGIFLHKVGLLS